MASPGQLSASPANTCNTEDNVTVTSARKASPAHLLRLSLSVAKKVLRLLSGLINIRFRFSAFSALQAQVTDNSLS